MAVDLSIALANGMYSFTIKMDLYSEHLNKSFRIINGLETSIRNAPKLLLGMGMNVMEKTLLL